MTNRKRLLKTFLQLVQIPSPSKEEGRVVGYIIKRLRSLGLKPFQDGFGNLIVNIKGKIREADPIFFNAHMDTVATDGKVKPQIKKGIIYSDGSTILGADDKAGIAAILELTTVLKEENIAHGNIQLIFTAAEEIGLKGAKNLDRKILTAHYDIPLTGEMWMSSFIGRLLRTLFQSKSSAKPPMPASTPREA
jgi:tripeptide aminopeptidase